MEVRFQVSVKSTPKQNDLQVKCTVKWMNQSMKGTIANVDPMIGDKE